MMAWLVRREVMKASSLASLSNRLPEVPLGGKTAGGGSGVYPGGTRLVYLK
jgi:hypothetical protein